MYCHHCGSCIEEEAAFCPNCGISLQTAPVEAAQPASNCAVEQQPVRKKDEPGKGLAIAGMVCGIVSIFYFRIIAGALGLIFGLVARHKGYQKGMATAGIACGSVGLGIGVLLFLLAFTVGLLIGQADPYAWDFFEGITDSIIGELL